MCDNFQTVKPKQQLQHARTISKETMVITANIVEGG